MPQSDDAVEQLRAQNEDEPENIVVGLVKQALEDIPIAGTAISYIRGKEKEKKEAVFDKAVLDILKAHDVSIDEIKIKLETENVVRVVAVAVERIFWGASEKKVKRFAAIVANSIAFGKEDDYFEDAASYIRALDELSDVDIKVLTHLYRHQGPFVQEDHAMPYNSFFQDSRMGEMIKDAAILGIQMDNFFSRCGRLTGYGLAIPLERRPDVIGPDSFAFRITLLGKRLAEMLLGTNQEATGL